MSRKYFWLLVAAVAVMTIPFVLPPASAQASTNYWPMFGQNPSHTGVGQGPAPTYVVLNWRFATNGPIFGSPTCVGNYVYIGSTDDYWYCLNAQTGALVWKYLVGSPIRSTAAVVNGELYTGRDDGYVYCLNATTGTQLWKSVVGAPSTPELSSCPTIVGNNLYIGAADNRVYCLNAATGAKIWNYTTGGQVNASPTVVNGKVYIGSMDQYMYCLNATNGALLWKFNTLYPGETSSRGLAYATGGVDGTASFGQGTIYFFSENGDRWWALNATTGKPIWLLWESRQRYNYQNPAPLSIKVGGIHPGDQPGNDPIGATTAPPDYGTPVYYNGNLYLYEDYFMMRFNATTGARIWAPWPGMTNPAYTDYLGNATLYGATQTGLQTPGNPYYRQMNHDLMAGFISQASMMYANGKIYLGTRANSIYVNNATTGQRLSWYQTGNIIYSSPALGNNLVYEGSEDWYLYCWKDGGISTYRAEGSYRPIYQISATLSSSNVAQGSSLTISGSVTPSPTADPYKGAPAVIAYFYRPDGTIYEDQWHLDSNSAGWYMGAPTYTLSYVPDMAGTWKVKVYLWATQIDPYQTTVTGNMTFTVASSSSVMSPASILTILSILAMPAIAIIPITSVLHKRKTK